MPSPETLREGLQTLGLAGILGVKIYIQLRLQRIEKDVEELKDEMKGVKDEVHIHDEEEALAEEPVKKPVEEPTEEGESWEVPERQVIPEPAPA